MTTPSIQTQRDNLNIGLFLARNPYGMQLDAIMQATLGYGPSGPPPFNDYQRYERRFRKAQQVGRDNFQSRVPGYFTVNAMPFGDIWIYKAIWYVLRNAKSGDPQIVPILTSDLASMQRFNKKYMATREASARSIDTALNIGEQRKAIAKQDIQAIDAIESRMLGDGSFGEIISGLNGLPYVDIEQILPQLPGREFGPKMKLDFQQSAKRIKDLQRRLRKEEVKATRQLAKWVMMKTGLPNNARQLALQDAANRLSNLP